MQAELIDYMGTDLSVVNAARVSFNKESNYDVFTDQISPGVFVDSFDLKDRDKKLINYLASHGHWTPFSHTAITLRMTAPVFIRTQCYKHKVGFVENEVSRRYVKDDPEFFFPDYWRAAPKNAKQGSDSSSPDIPQQLINEAYRSFIAHVEDLYTDMIEGKIAPEQARMVLPQSMYTQWYWTGNLVSYSRFCKLRKDEHAQKEIQDLAREVESIIEPLYPVSWKALMEN